MPNIDTSTPIPLLPPVVPEPDHDTLLNLQDLHGDREAAHRWEDSEPDDELAAANQPINWAGAQELSEFNPNLFEYPPIPTLAQTLVPENRDTLFDDGHLESQYVNPRPRSTEVGIPALLTTGQDVATALSVVAAQNVKLLYQGQGIIVGVSVIVGALATAWVGLSDSLDGNGPLLAVFTSSGFINFGIHGLRITYGLTLVNNLGNKIACIPIIKGSVPVNP